MDAGVARQAEAFRCPFEAKGGHVRFRWRTEAMADEDKAFAAFSGSPAWGLKDEPRAGGGFQDHRAGKHVNGSAGGLEDDFDFLLHNGYVGYTTSDAVVQEFGFALSNHFQNARFSLVDDTERVQQGRQAVRRLRFGCKKSSGEIIVKTTILALVVAFGTYGEGWAKDWPAWRGPMRDGISTETGWFKAGAASKVVWEGNVGAGYSGLSIKGGKLYTMGNRDGKDVVLCLDAKTGKSVWEFEYPCEAGSYAGPRCTPAVDDAFVYVISRHAQVFCLDSSKGTLRWKRDLKAEMGVKLPTWGISGSPVIEGDLLLVNVGARGLAMMKATGATTWDSGTEDSGYASPVVTGEGGKRSVIVFGAKTVGATDLMTGRKRWDHPWVTSYNVNAADPIVVDGNVLITSGYGRGGSLLNVSGDKPVVLWESKNMASHFSTPVIREGYAYGGSGNTGKGDVRCVEVKSGEVKWESNGIGYASMVLADGKLLMLGDKGTLAIAEATPVQYKELWKEKVLDGTCWTVPTLCDGLIYCRNDKGRLICLDLKGQ